MLKDKIRKMALLVVGLSLVAPATQAGETVNIYSYRQPDLIAPVLDEFTRQTGIKTRVAFLKKGLAEKLEAEGVNSPADVILTTDIGRLSVIAAKNLSQPVLDAGIWSNIPSQYRDPDGRWFGITLRARVVFASRQRVDQDEITYEELMDPKWRGRICTRSGQHPYNIALFSAMIAQHGDAYTQTWLDGVKQNLARKPDGNERAQAKGIFSGECDIALGNTYYVGLMQTNEAKPEQKDWAKSIKVLFPNSQGRGTHVNISGMALARYAPNRDAGIKLMTFLASDAAQEIFADNVFEYPVKSGLKASAIVAGMGSLNPDSLPLETIARFRKDASRIVDKVGYDNGPGS